MYSAVWPPPDPDPLDSSFEQENWANKESFDEFFDSNLHSILHLGGYGDKYDDHFYDTSPLDILNLLNLNLGGRSTTNDTIIINNVTFSFKLALWGATPGASALLFNTGASSSFTDDLNDVVGELRLTNATVDAFGQKDIPVDGACTICWNVVDTNGKVRSILVEGYYVSQGTRKLFSPQAHFQAMKEAGKPNGKLVVKADYLDYQDPTGWKLRKPISDITQLPTIVLHQNDTKLEMNNAYLLRPVNPNLTMAQKELMLWHQQLGHMGCTGIQKLMKRPIDGSEPCILTKNCGTPNCQVPLCPTCLLAKAKCRNDETSTEKKDELKTMSLERNHLEPGSCVSLDHYESTVQGRHKDTKGKEQHDNKYCGGTIFVNHASGFIGAYHKVSLTAGNTIASKREFKKRLRECGVQVQQYHGDNGVFKSEAFTNEIEEMEQTIDFSGVGAHHQNGVAEQGIQLVFYGAQAMMIHAAMHWPQRVLPDLWPFAVDYAIHIWNHTPLPENGLCPVEILCKYKQSCVDLTRLQVWGCPAYVLDPKLQDGKKLPKWKPRSCCGQFFVFSEEHSSTVGMIHNLNTGYVSPQFHVVYNERFETVLGDTITLDRDIWLNLFCHHCDYYPDEDDSPPCLSTDWNFDDRPRLQHPAPVDAVVPEGELGNHNRI